MRKIIRKIILIAFLGLSFAGCRDRGPIKLGLVADFTGRSSQLGIQGRNGLVMAVEELNKQGGIDGRTIEYLYRDHRGDKIICESVVTSLIEEGVHIIIGPMTSGMASTVIDTAARAKVLVIGPTVSTDELTGIDDNFIRGISPASNQGKFLASAIKPLNLKNIFFLMDRRNKTYSDAVVSGYEREMDPGNQVNSLYFSGKEDFSNLVESLKNKNPDGLVLVASGIDSAGIIQLYGKQRDLPRLFGTSWSKVTKILEYGGRTVEGMIIVDSFTNREPLEREIQFKKRYQILYGVEPNIAAITTYESVKLYAKALKQSGTTESDRIKEAILGMRHIQGITDNYEIDIYGDGVRDLSTFIVENGKYKLLVEKN